MIPGPAVDTDGTSNDCYTLSKNATGSYLTIPIWKTKCNQPSFFVCQLGIYPFNHQNNLNKSFNVCIFTLDQSLAKQLQPFISQPVAILPLSTATGLNDLSPNKISSTESIISFDPLYTPAGLYGSPMFSTDFGPNSSFISVNATPSMGIQGTSQVTVLLWIRPDVASQGTILVRTKGPF